MAKRTLVPRTRAGGLWTEARFWSFIRSNIRQMSIKWPPINQAKIDARRPYVGPNKQQKWEYQCSICEQWFPDKKVQVHHSNPCGTLKDYEHIGPFVKRMLCENENGNLPVVCVTCHQIETHGNTESP